MSSGLRSVVMVVLWAAWMPAAGWAMTPVQLLDGNLQPHEATLQSLHRGTITYFGSDRALRTEAAGRFLQLRPVMEPDRDRASAKPTVVHEGEGSTEAGATVVLTLVDGQRLTGTLTSAPASAASPTPSNEPASDTAPGTGESLWLTHDRLGITQVPLERISSLTAASVPTPMRTPAADEVTLSNGDQIDGFITAITPTHLLLQMAGQDQPVQLNMALIRQARLANPRDALESEVALIHLRAGDRIAGRELSIWDDRASIQPILPGATSTFDAPLHEIARIDLPGAGRRLVDPMLLEWRMVSGGEVFGVPMPPVMHEGAMALHAPVTVEIPLPPRSTRFAATASLDLSAVHGVRPLEGWADMKLILRSGGEVLWQGDINADAPSARISVAIPGPDLTITVEPARNGPILDRLRIDDAVLLLGP